MAQLVRNMHANSGGARDTGSVPGLERSSGKGNATHSSILAWRISWTEESGGLQSRVAKSQTRLSMRAHTHTHTHTHRGLFDHTTYLWGC